MEKSATEAQLVLEFELGLEFSLESELVFAFEFESEFEFVLVSSIFLSHETLSGPDIFPQKVTAGRTKEP